MDDPKGKIVGFKHDRVGDFAVVDVDEGVACQRCAAGRGCGAGILGRSGKVRRVEARVAEGHDLREGDRVYLQLAASNVLKAAVLVYGLPLAGAAIAAALAYLLGLGDAAAAALAIAGLGLGYQLGRRRLQRPGCLADFTPTITGRAASGG